MSRPSSAQFGRRKAVPMWFRSSVAAAAGAVVVIGAGVIPALAAPAPVTTTFRCTGGSQTWTVPQGVTSANVTVDGPTGGSLTGESRGGRVTATMQVVPGTTYIVVAGCRGGFSTGGFGYGRGGDGGRIVDSPEHLGGGGGGGGSAVLTDLETPDSGGGRWRRHGSHPGQLPVSRWRWGRHRRESRGFQPPQWGRRWRHPGDVGSRRRDRRPRFHRGSARSRPQRRQWRLIPLSRPRRRRRGRRRRWLVRRRRGRRRRGRRRWRLRICGARNPSDADYRRLYRTSWSGIHHLPTAGQQTGGGG